MIYVAIIALVIYTLLTAGKLVLDASMQQAQIQQLSDIQGQLHSVADVLLMLVPTEQFKPAPNVQAAAGLHEPLFMPPKPVQVPNDVLDYIGAESEEWAQDARQNRAYELYAEFSDWSIVLQTLRREDGELAK